MDVNRLLDETVEKTTDLDGWLSRKASLKIQKARGKNLPRFVKRNMRGMTEAQRNRYRKKLLKRRAFKARRKKALMDARNKMKQAVIQRKIRNANALESFKERRRKALLRAKLAKIKAGIRRQIARKNMQETRALAVRNATHPGTIMAQAEKRRVMAGRRHSNRIMRGKKDIFKVAVQPTSETPTSGTPDQWFSYLRRILQSKGRDSDEFRQAVLGVPQDVINRMSPHRRRAINKLKSTFANPSIGGLGIGRLTQTQCENLRAIIKRHFLETVAKARGVTDPADKTNIMRQFWDKWQPILSVKPQLYNWFKTDEHIRNAMLDFRGLGDWDQFTPAESQYLQGTTTDTERAFLLGERPGEVDAYTALHPIAEGDLFDVEDLMPNVPAPQPDLYGIENFTERFDVESLMPGVPNIEPKIRRRNR